MANPTSPVYVSFFDKKGVLMKRYEDVKMKPGLALSLINHDEMMLMHGSNVIVVNDLDVRYPSDKELLSKYLMTNYEGLTFSMIPSCDCGKLKGGYQRGHICPHCNSEVLSQTEIPINSNLWIKTLDNVRPFLNPIAFIKLSEAFTYGRINIIRWLCDVHYKANFDDNIVITKLRNLKIKRGYNNFVDNFWEIIDILLNKRIYTSQSDKRKDILSWLIENKDKLFSEYLPLPNRLALVIEKTSTGRYGELLKYSGGIEAANLIASVKERITPPNQTSKETIVFRCILLLSEYYLNQYSSALGGKKGLIRKHICGSRVPFSARNVITSLHEAHKYDELHIPWGMAIGLFRLHLINKFLRDGFTTNEALGYINRYANRWDTRIRGYFDELFAESYIEGIPCCFNRNPTLLRGSIQQLRITKIKDDVRDVTIRISVLVLPSYNAEKNKFTLI